MKMRIEPFKNEMTGTTVKVVTSNLEVAYLKQAPERGEVVRFVGANGPVFRMIHDLES